MCSKNNFKCGHGKNHQINFNHPNLFIEFLFAVIGFSEGLSNLDENWCRPIFWDVDFEYDVRLSRYSGVWPPLFNRILTFSDIPTFLKKIEKMTIAKQFWKILMSFLNQCFNCLHLIRTNTTKSEVTFRPFGGIFWHSYYFETFHLIWHRLIQAPTHYFLKLIG